MRHYMVTKLPKAKLWAVSLIDDTPESFCRIGEFKSRKEAWQCARLLAGWNGKVSLAVTYAQALKEGLVR